MRTNINNPSNWNGIDTMAAELLVSSVVTGQTATFKDGEGNKYRAKQVTMGSNSITVVWKNDNKLAVMHYDHDFNTERWEHYNGHTGKPEEVSQ